MNNISISFMYPWLLFLIIPLILLSIWPYFRLPKKHRKSRNRLTSMVLHIMIICLLTIVLSGMKIHNNYISKKTDVMILIDQSMSQMDHQDEIDNFLAAVVADLPADYRLGIAEFGANALYTVPMSHNKQNVLESYLNRTLILDQSATDIEGALIFARNQLDHVKNGRIILVSDGRQTDGNAILAASLLRESGTRVDVKYITPTLYEKDAQVIRLILPDNVQRGLSAQINVVVASTTTGLADLNIIYTNHEGVEVMDTQEVMLTPGTHVFGFEHVFMDYGLTQIKVVLDADESIDFITENNQYFGYVDIRNEASQGILIIEGNLDEGAALESIIEDGGYDVTRIGVNNLPTHINELTVYQEIILVNVKNSDLTPTGFESILNTYVRNYGGGLLTIGGDRAYQKQDMTGEGVNQTFDQLLPVESNTDPKSMAVVIVMDASGSMTANGSNKFNLAKAGAKASIQALYDSKGDTNHMFGVVTFDGSQRDVIEMTSVDNIDTILPQIDALTTGKGTRYIQGLQKAKDMLSDVRFNNSQKHIIFLTDGGPQDDVGLYTGVLDSLGDISVSTIALGNAGENDLDPAKVEAMVRTYNNRGAYYRVTSINQLDGVMRQDTEQAQSGDFINEAEFTGVFRSMIPAFASIGELIPLDGYYGTRVKPAAQMIVQTETDDPLYAQWRPSTNSGMVGSFMSDLNGDVDGFSHTFVEHYIGKAFILGMVRSVLPSSEVINNEQVNVSYTHQNKTSTIRIRTTIEDGETLRANIIDPSGRSQRISLTNISRTTFAGMFERDEVGVYILEVTKYARNGSVISVMRNYSAYHYSDEYINSYDEEATIVLMDDIANAGGGSYIVAAENLFTTEAETVSEMIDPSVIFIVISLVLFLLDIIARKFKFKWPHEFFRKEKMVNIE